MRIFWLIIVAIFFLSCRRQKIEKKHPEFCHDWYHHVSENEYYYLRIPDNGTAYSKVYRDGKLKEEHSRQWYIKDSYLLLGLVSSKKESRKSSFSFKIITYPAVATYSFISNYDTVNVGDNYMMLVDNQVYVNHVK